MLLLKNILTHDQGRCPHCGYPMPEDPERYDLGGRIFCPRCGAEWPGEEGGEEVGRD